MAKSSKPLSRAFSALGELFRTSTSRRQEGLHTRPDLIRTDFADPEELLHAVEKLRAMGVIVLETYTPFPIHHMDEALGEQRSRLPWVTGLLGLTGFSGALALQYWTSVIDYPLVIGGKPLASIPAFIPVLFESTVLLAGLGTVATLFAITKLRPRLKIPNLHIGANDDRFVMVAALGNGHTFESLSAELAGMSAIETTRLLTDARAKDGGLAYERDIPLPLALAGILLPAAAVLALGAGLNRDFTRRVFEFDAGMTFPVSAQAYDPSPVLRRGQVLQLPPTGTVARGATLPLKYAAGKDEAERAGRELTSPFEATPANLARGKVVWGRICGTCHGEGAKGDGGVIPRFPNPPNLVIPKYEPYPEGRLFHVATFGGPEKIMKPFGDHLSEKDRWLAAMHLRRLMDDAMKERAAKAAGAPAAAGAGAPAAIPAAAPAAVPATTTAQPAAPAAGAKS